MLEKLNSTLRVLGFVELLSSVRMDMFGFIRMCVKDLYLNHIEVLKLNFGFWMESLKIKFKFFFFKKMAIFLKLNCFWLEMEGKINLCKPFVSWLLVLFLVCILLQLL